MKQTNKLLLLLLSLGMSMHMLTAMEGAIEYNPTVKNSAKSAPKQNVIDVYNLPKDMDMKALLAAHNQTSNPSLEDLSKPTKHQSEPAYPGQEGVYGFLSRGPNSAQKIFTPFDVPDPAKVTPSAFLTATLQEATSFENAFDKLQAIATDKKNYSTSQQLLAQQARTLLVRARPEVIPNLATNLRLLPNRFVSYFKQQLPRLTTAAGKQRFTQSVMMEALKAMPDFNQNTFEPELDRINAKYTSDLDPLMENNDWSTQASLVSQWSRNMITELALLAPRTAGAAVGAGVGAIAGISINYGDPAFPTNPISGAIDFGTAGAQAGEGLARSAANAVGRGARATYHQGAKSFTPRSQLTEANLKTDSQSNELDNKANSDKNSLN